MHRNAFAVLSDDRFRHDIEALPNFVPDIFAEPAFSCDVRHQFNVLAISEGLQRGVENVRRAPQLYVKGATQEKRSKDQGCAKPSSSAKEVHPRSEKGCSRYHPPRRWTQHPGAGTDSRGISQGGPQHWLPCRLEIELKWWRWGGRRRDGRPGRHLLVWHAQIEIEALSGT